MKMRWIWAAALAACSFGATVPSARADEEAGHPCCPPNKEAMEKGHAAKAPYSPYVGRAFPTRPLFGDQHVHTGYSMDAGAFGCRLTPKDAYRYARGEEIAASSGQRAKLSRPLDWLVVSDHSDNMGFFPALIAGKPEQDEG